MSCAKRILLTFIAINLLTGSAYAGISNDIPSCYAANKLGAAPLPEREVFVLVDQTTQFDNNLKKSILENTGRVLKPGAAFVIASFSSYSQGKYSEIITAGSLEATLNQNLRDDTSVRLLKGFDACMSGQLQYGAKIMQAGMIKAMSGSSSDLAKSDVLASLKEISSRIRQSPAKEKIVLIASDMLENSSISSFYAKQAVRQINVESELKLVAENQLFGDFGGARVYVVGAGLISEDINSTKGVYRSQQVMLALSTFWKTWFQKSNADIIEFGQPALLNPVR